ncbi:hypothetical protein CRUP_027925, partial [Coryphaenoides rupestris]
MAGLVNFEDEQEVKQFLDNLARLADYLEGVKKDYRSTAKVLEHSCETYEHGESCYKLGTYHITGKGGVSKCLQTAYTYFLRACSAGGRKCPDACHNVALLAHDGRATQGGPDAVAARRYYEKACADGFAPSCFNLSALLIEGNGAGLPPDMPAALRYASRACELGHVWGCANASRMYKLGDGTPKDEQRAGELKRRAQQLHGLQGHRQLKFG